MCTTILEAGPKSHKTDCFVELNSIMVVYMDTLGTGSVRVLESGLSKPVVSEASVLCAVRGQRSFGTTLAGGFRV